MIGFGKRKEKKSEGNGYVGYAKILGRLTEEIDKLLEERTELLNQLGESNLGKIAYWATAKADREENVKLKAQLKLARQYLEIIVASAPPMSYERQNAVEALSQIEEVK